MNSVRSRKRPIQMLGGLRKRVRESLGGEKGKSDDCHCVVRDGPLPFSSPAAETATTGGFWRKKWVSKSANREATTTLRLSFGLFLFCFACSFASFRGRTSFLESCIRLRHKTEPRMHIPPRSTNETKTGSRRRGGACFPVAVASSH